MRTNPPKKDFPLLSDTFVQEQLGKTGFTFPLYSDFNFKWVHMDNFLRFCSIVSIIIASIKLALIGHLTPGTVVLIIICGLLILVGNRTIYIIVAAVAALVLFVKIYGGGTAIGESSLLQNLLTIALVVFGLHFMLRSFLPYRRNSTQLRRK
ncbi:MAG: hypothetical protein A2266_09240 [Bacteroidetes bacterium RIFOXYA12_FULL_40_10]|nr:MAG: hypothetical protein US49_C0004G0026 [candidate division TM6 bacterium GW2011_GWF2_37_49]OFY91350.1 MAG: hypothetical protein A2266_09240 [Bacteroidetes bacterium RIFOXYA12_FULL_40_10]HBG62229.1 hypothetical protein [Candidatus Omnitrophota bacterium]